MWRTITKAQRRVIAVVLFWLINNQNGPNIFPSVIMTGLDIMTLYQPPLASPHSFGVNFIYSSGHTNRELVINSILHPIPPLDYKNDDDGRK